uniref:Uncharacterized protein n=1 Tax=Lepeophtheirus salmonis TaxID=72036 RepID=A0A0K2V0S9_LEPSM
MSYKKNFGFKVPRQNLELSKYSALCEQHLISSDYKLESEDTNKVCRKDPNIVRKILKKDAIPSLDNNWTISSSTRYAKFSQLIMIPLRLTLDLTRENAEQILISVLDNI